MIVHMIRHGDTFWRLARRYGVSVEAIRAANPRLNPLNLQPGTRLVVPLPAVEMIPHRVLPGETLWVIAARYGVSAPLIMVINRLAAPYRLRPGQILMVPLQVVC